MLHFADNLWRETEHATQTATLLQQTLNCANIEQIIEIHIQLLEHWHIEQYILQMCGKDKTKYEQNVDSSTSLKLPLASAN